MGANHAVPVAAVHQLYPGHVNLYEGGAAPLAGLEEDEADGAVVCAHRLEHAQDAALRAVEPEGDVVGAQLVFDAHEAEGPELEIVTDAQPYPLAPEGIEGREVALLFLAVDRRGGAAVGYLDPLLPQMSGQTARPGKLLHQRFVEHGSRDILEGQRSVDEPYRTAVACVAPLAGFG